MTRPADRWPPLSVVSGTTLRFVLLVLAVLAASTQLFATLFQLLPGNYQRRQVVSLYCEAAYSGRIKNLDLRLDPQAFSNDIAMQQLSAARQGRLRCLAPLNREIGFWVMAGLAALLLVALLIYLGTPWWKRRRHHQLELPRSPRLARDLTRLVTASDLRPEPGFVMGDADTMDAVTFGRSGRYVVQLNAGLIPLHRSDPDLFRAIVLHELAHIRNRDVDIGYAALAVWRSFLAVAVVPFVALTFLTLVLGTAEGWSRSGLAVEVARVLLFVVITYLTRNAVFRVRELYADARAATVPGTVNGLVEAVGLADSPLSPVARWVGVHPPARSRLTAISKPQVLLHPGFWDLADSGCVGMVAATAGMQYASLFMAPWTAAGFVVIAVMTLLVGALTAVVWRSAVLTARYGERRQALRPALGLGLGVLLGDALAMSGEPRFWGVLGPSSQLSVGAAVVAATLLLTGLLLIAAWAANLATRWLPVLRGASPRWGWAGGTIAASLAFSSFIIAWYRHHIDPRLITWTWTMTSKVANQDRLAYWEGPASRWITLRYAPLDAVLHDPLVIPILVLVILLPLLPRPRPPLASAVLAGVLGGAYLIVGQLLLRTLVPLLFPIAAAQPGFGFYFLYWQVACAVAAQAVVGGVVAVRRLPVAAALLAAFVTGSIGAVALPVLGFDDLPVNGDLILAVLPYVLVEGAIAAGVVAAIIGALRPDGKPLGTMAVSRVLACAAPLLVLLAVNLMVAELGRPPVYALHGDVCQVADTTALLPLAGINRPTTTQSKPLENQIPGGLCEIHLDGPIGYVGLTITVVLPPGGQAAAVNLFTHDKAAELQPANRTRTYRDFADLGTQAWRWRETEGSAPEPLRPHQSTTYSIIIQDGGLFLHAYVSGYPLNRNPLIVPEQTDWPQTEDIETLIYKMASRTMRNLEE